MAVATVHRRDDDGLIRTGWEGMHGVEEWRERFRAKTINIDDQLKMGGGR